MKKNIIIFCLLILQVFSVNAQSRRVPPTSPNGKVNSRTPPPDASPTPSVKEVEPTTDNQTVINDTEVFTIDIELVTVPVKVYDRSNRLVNGLTKENFQILEDDVPQEIAYFSNEAQPFTVALVLDMSYSGTYKIAEIQNAALAFIAQLRENDKVMVVSFDEQVHLLCNPTTDRKIIYSAIKKTSVNSGTSVYDALDLVMNERFKKISGRKAIVLFTDGVDTTSRRASSSNNISDALELDALIYPIQYDTFNDVQAIKNKSVIIQPPTVNNPFPVPTIPNGTPGSEGTTVEEYKKADEYLIDLANRTGGRIYKAVSTSNLPLAFSRIAAELREFYSLGYYPKADSQTGKRRKIKVRVNRQNLVVRSRTEYVIKKKGRK